MNKKKLLLVLPMTLVFLILYYTVAWAYDALTIEARVGQYKIYVDGEMNRDDNQYNLYYDNARKTYMPITLVYNDQIYIPAKMLNQNVNFDYKQEKNAIYFNSMDDISSEDLILKQKEDQLSNIGNEKTDLSPESTENLKAYKVINFKDDDLKFSKYANFQVGVDTCSKFYNFYSKWIKHSSMVDKVNQRVSFYDYDPNQEYSNFTIFMTYNTKTKVVKDVQFIETKKKDTNAQFKTFRGISTGSTIKAMTDAYGNDYVLAAHENAYYNLVSYTYHFKTTSGKTGTLTFYASYNLNADISSAIIDSIDLNVN